MSVSVAQFEGLDAPHTASTASLIAREPALLRTDSASCFHARYRALNRGAENISRAS
jgi:hypothetical protein